MAKVPEKMADGSERAPNLTRFLQEFVDHTGIEQGFLDASSHSYTCTCEKCAAWWKSMGPEDGEWGPFGKNPPWLTQKGTTDDQRTDN